VSGVGSGGSHRLSGGRFEFSIRTKPNAQDPAVSMPAAFRAARAGALRQTLVFSAGKIGEKILALLRVCIDAQDLDLR